MEPKAKSENIKENLEMVLESISDDLRTTNADSTVKLVNSTESLNAKIDRLLSIKKGPDSDREDFLKEIKSEFAKISDFISKSSFSTDKLQKLSDALERNRQEQTPPLSTKVIHYHHISKGIWLSVALLIFISLESAGWLNTVNKLDQFTENDTKYRFMRLDTAARNLQIYLDSMDTRYQSDPNMLNLVIELEGQYRKNIERLEKAERLKQEAKDLENKVHTQ